MREYVIEFLGTFFLTLVILWTGDWLSIGAALAIIVILGSGLSATAYNPAVVLALVAAKKLPNNVVFPYILAEIAGGLAAVEFVKFLKGK